MKFIVSSINKMSSMCMYKFVVLNSYAFFTCL